MKIKYLSLIILNIVFISSGFVCAKNPDDNSPLPDKRPGDLYFRYAVNGGMMYYSEEIYLCSDSCFYKIIDGGFISRVDFSLSTDELDKLYSVFKDNNFDKIKTYEEKVYDRGGESISLGWNKNRYARVSNSGITFIKDSWQMEWAACSNAIETIGKNELEKQKKDYLIKFDKSLFGSEIYMQVNRNVVIPKSMLMAERETDSTVTKTVMLIPGSHNARVTIGKSYYTIIINADSSKSMRLYMLNDSLRHEFVK